MNENARFPNGFHQFSTILRCHAFEYANGCSANRNDAASGSFRAMDRVRGFLAEFITLRVHFVRVEGFGFDRQKCAGTDVECDKANLHAP